jgi:acetyl-CoA acetyltransferase
MDGAWALHEAWVRLQHGDVDVALVFSSGRASLGVSLRETLTFQLDPYYLAPLGADYVSLAALQGEAVMARTGRTERDLADIVAARTGLDVDKLLAEPYVVAPLRPHDIGPPVDGAAAVVLVAGDRARDLCERPAWIAGIDHRVDPHYPGVRDLSRSRSTTLAGEKAGVGQGGIEVAELHAVCTPEEIVLTDALGLGDDVDINPSGGAIAANPMMVTGLVRIGEAFKQIAGGRSRALGHASSGPCLQQNLVCVLEGR